MLLADVIAMLPLGFATYICLACCYCHVALLWQMVMLLPSG